MTAARAGAPDEKVELRWLGQAIELPRVSRFGRYSIDKHQHASLVVCKIVEHLTVKRLRCGSGLGESALLEHRRAAAPFGRR
jgi:hypothetical protein